MSVLARTTWRHIPEDGILQLFFMLLYELIPLSEDKIQRFQVRFPTSDFFLAVVGLEQVHSAL
jgi:hypothetical protein